jgi:hypothetical protein
MGLRLVEAVTPFDGAGCRQLGRQAVARNVKRNQTGRDERRRAMEAAAAARTNSAKRSEENSERKKTVNEERRSKTQANEFYFNRMKMRNFYKLRINACF